MTLVSGAGTPWTGKPEKLQSPHQSHEFLAVQLRRLKSAAGEGNAIEVQAITDDILARVPTDIQTLSRVSSFFFQNQDYHASIPYLAALVALQPNDEHRTQLAIALTKAGAGPAAFDISGRLISKSPLSLPLWQIQFEAVLVAEDDEVLTRWLHALSTSRIGENAAFTGEVLRQLGAADKSSAINDFLINQPDQPGDLVGLLRQAAIFAYRQKNWDVAEHLWAKIAARSEPSRQREVRLYQARIAHNRGDADAAVMRYTAAFDANPAEEEAARFLIRHFVKDMRLDRAEDICNRYEKTAGDMPSVAIFKAQVLQARGDSAGAAREFERATARWPKHIDLRLQWSDGLAAAGNIRAALAPLEHAASIDPNDPSVLARQIRLMHTLGEAPELLLPLVNRYLSIRPDDIGMLRQKANLHVRSGQRRAAIEALRKAVDINPRQPGHWQTLVSNLLILNDVGEVATLLAEARKVFCSDTLADQLAIGEILEAADRPDEALQHAAAAVALDDKAGEPRLMLARIYEGKGLYRQAWPMLVEASELDSGLGKHAGIFARIAKCLSYVDSNPSNAESNQFPDAVMHRISSLATPNRLFEPTPAVLQVTGSLAAGGAERQVAMTMLGLTRHAAAGLHPVLVAQDLNPGTGRDFFLPMLTSSGCEIVVLSDIRAQGKVRDLAATRPDLRADIMLLSALPPSLSVTALPLYQLIVERRPRIVHLWQDTTAVAGGIAAMLAGVPQIVLGTRSTRPVERQRARAWLHGGYHALLNYPGTVMINNSRNGANDYTAWLGLKPGLIRTIYNGFEFDAMESRRDPAVTASVRQRAQAGSGDVVIGGVMRLSFEKRPDLWLSTVIELCKRSPNVRGVLAGDGPMMKELTEQTASAGMADRILFAGRQTPIEPWMAAMDVLFLSSMTEGLPNVLIEAQSLGVMVATMRVGGAPETVLEGKTAVVIDEGTPQSIADAIQPFVASAQLRKSFGAAGAHWATSTFSNDAMIDQLKRIYAVS